MIFRNQCFCRSFSIGLDKESKNKDDAHNFDMSKPKVISIPVKDLYLYVLPNRNLPMAVRGKLEIIEDANLYKTSTSSQRLLGSLRWD